MEIKNLMLFHQVLYCDTDSNEREIYGRRFDRIIKRSKLKEDLIKADENAITEFKQLIVYLFTIGDFHHLSYQISFIQKSWLKKPLKKPQKFPFKPQEVSK